jgi:hypothetical protein
MIFITKYLHPILTVLLIGAVCFLFFQGATCNGNKRVDEHIDKSRENITSNCFDYILFAAKKEKWAAANNALCLCQQTADKGNQNLCKNSQGMINFQTAVTICVNLAKQKKENNLPFMDFKECLKKTAPGYD